MHVVHAETLYRTGKFDWLQELWKTCFHRVEARYLDFGSSNNDVVFDAFVRVWAIGDYDHGDYRRKHCFHGVPEARTPEERSNQGGSVSCHGFGPDRNIRDRRQA